MKQCPSCASASFASAACYRKAWCTHACAGAGSVALRRPPPPPEGLISAITSNATGARNEGAIFSTEHLVVGSPVVIKVQRALGDGGENPMLVYDRERLFKTLLRVDDDAWAPLEAAVASSENPAKAFFTGVVTDADTLTMSTTPTSMQQW